MLYSQAHLFMHVIFSTRHRRPFITDQIEPAPYSYMAKILYDECYSPAVIIGGDKDHLHILLTQSRNWSIEKIVDLIKKRSSEWIRARGKQFSDFQWQEGYACFSVSKSEVPALKDYIADQKEHHKKETYKDEYVQFLEEHGIDYDEGDMWD